MGCLCSPVALALLAMTLLQGAQGTWNQTGKTPTAKFQPYLSRACAMRMRMTLQEVQVQLIDTAACNSLYNIDPSPNIGRDPIKPDMICASYVEGQRDSCQDDSGGPLACDHNGTWFLMGVVSWGDDCGQPNRPSVYVRTVAYGEWIWGHVVSRGQATSMENSISGVNDARSSFSTYTLLFTTLLMSL